MKCRHEKGCLHAFTTVCYSSHFLPRILSLHPLPVFLTHILSADSSWQKKKCLEKTLLFSFRASIISTNLNWTRGWFYVPWSSSLEASTSKLRVQHTPYHNRLTTDCSSQTPHSPPPSSELSSPQTHWNGFLLKSPIKDVMALGLCHYKSDDTLLHCGSLNLPLDW